MMNIYIWKTVLHGGHATIYLCCTFRSIKQLFSWNLNGTIFKDRLENIAHKYCYKYLLSSQTLNISECMSYAHVERQYIKVQTIYIYKQNHQIKKKLHALQLTHKNQLLWMKRFLCVILFNNKLFANVYLKFNLMERWLVKLFLKSQ